MGSITTRAYGTEISDVESGVDLDVVSDLLASACELVWIDMDDPEPKELQHLADELGLHHLSVEDALDPHQRDKYVHFEHHVFLVSHAIELDVERAALTTAEIDTFIGDRWIVTVHHGREDFMEKVATRWDQARELGGRSVGFVMYALLDVISDGYFDAIDAFERYYDEVADRVFGESPIEPSAHRQWFEMRKALNEFDRIIGPLAEALQTVVAQDLDRFPDVAAPYLRDVAGELARASVEVDSLRELVNHIVDANLVLRDYHQNVVMKKVTSWAAIIAVPTLGHRVVRHERAVPRFRRDVGRRRRDSAVAVTCSASLYALFRRRQWL